MIDKRPLSSAPSVAHCKDEPAFESDEMCCKENGGASEHTDACQHDSDADSGSSRPASGIEQEVIEKTAQE